MGFQIDTSTRYAAPTTKTCSKCGETKNIAKFVPVKNWMFDGYLPVCAACIKQYLFEAKFDWDTVDKICQLADIPFIPREWERLRALNGNDTFPMYASVFMAQEFERLGWSDYYKRFRELRDEHLIEEELPGIGDEKYVELRARWGSNYENSELDYLENLMDGIYATQNVNGKLQEDQALKLCKISLEIDSRIRAGEDVDKLLTSYDRLVKIAEFTPRNVKNASDFDSIGELVRWLEKRGWHNSFYDDVPKDVVDETMRNIQSYNQRLYTNESGIGDEITKRIEALKEAREMELSDDIFGFENEKLAVDTYENEGFNAFFDREEHDEVFDPNGGETASE